jgi:hypothetical protein
MTTDQGGVVRLAFRTLTRPWDWRDDPATMQKPTDGK